MRKHLLILLPLFLLVVVPAFASQSKNEKNEKLHEPQIKINRESNDEDPVSKSEAISVSVKPEVSVECDPDEEWENHGKYVSCVAKLHLGGKEVSEAAKSDIGKKHKSDKDDITPSVNPSAAISLTPTASTSVTPTAQSSLTVTPPFSESVTLPKNQLDTIVKVLEKMLNFFKNLI